MILVSLVSCENGNSGNTNTDTNAAANSSENEPSGNDTAADTANNTATDTESAKLTGKLNIIDLEDRDASILRGVRIIGNSVGSIYYINGKEKACIAGFFFLCKSVQTYIFRGKNTQT